MGDMMVPVLVASPAMQRILRVLEKKADMSISDMSAEAFVGMTTLAYSGYVKAMKARRLIFISGWRKVNGRFSTPLYSLGNLADVSRPKIDDKCRDAPGMWIILETLKRYGNLTYQDIARFSGLSPNTVKNSGYLNALIVQQHIYIGGWRHSHRGPMLPIYHVGKGVAAAKPSAITATEKSRNFRERGRIAIRGPGLRAQLIALGQ